MRETHVLINVHVSVVEVKTVLTVDDDNVFELLCRAWESDKISFDLLQVRGIGYLNIQC